MKGKQLPPTAVGPEARWQELLRTADASVERALKLAGITSAADLLATTDLQFLQLPRVGKAVLRGVQQLKQSLAGEGSNRRGPKRVTKWITLELQPAMEQNLLARTAEVGLKPGVWLQQAVLAGVAAGQPLGPAPTPGPDSIAPDALPTELDARLIPLGKADPEVVRALQLAGARTISQLAALTGWQLLELPGVGNGAVRKVRALRRSLGLPPDLSRARSPHGASYSIRVEVDEGRLAQLAAAAGLSPWTWLRRTLLDSLRPRAETANAKEAVTGTERSGAE